jgi:hypothetical protein
MQHAAIIAALCVATLFKIRSLVPLGQRSQLELRILIAWARLTIAVLEHVRDWLLRR